MYTLLSGLYKYMFQKDEYCILILGLDNAGKTVCARPSVTTPSVLLVVVYLLPRVLSSCFRSKITVLFCLVLKEKAQEGMFGK